MKYKTNDRVVHPNMGSWGLGAVLEDSNEKQVRVFFVGVGEKILLLEFVQLIVVNKEENTHPILENLKLSDESPTIEYLSLPSSIEFFLSNFPEGFYGEKYLTEERGYKLAAHNLSKEILNKDIFLELIKTDNYDEITKRALKISNSTNLIFANEKMSLKDGLNETENKEKFSLSLYDLLYGNKEFKDNFQSFCTLLENIDANKWTTASYFPFIVHPEKYMFVKPTVTQHAANLSRFEIHYRPQLNWTTYKLILCYADYLKSELEALKPRDMIDVQSFMWFVAPNRK